MSSMGLNQGPVNPTPATLVLREKGGGGPFCFLGVHNQRVVSNLPPPFFNFPFPLFCSNHCYQSGACFKWERGGRESGGGEGKKKREKGGSSLMEPSLAPGLISQRLHMCLCVWGVRVWVSGECLSIRGHLTFHPNDARHTLHSLYHFLWMPPQHSRFCYILPFPSSMLADTIVEDDL